MLQRSISTAILTAAICLLVGGIVATPPKPRTIITVPNWIGNGDAFNVSVLFNDRIREVMKVEVTLSDKHRNWTSLYTLQPPFEVAELLLIPSHTYVWTSFQVKIQVSNSDQSYRFDQIQAIVVRDEHYLNLFIQTDKPIYKPSDTLKIRVLVTDTNLRPLQNDDKEYILDIKNGKNDIIKRVYKNADKEQKYEDYGMLEFSYLIPSYANLGTWSIEFTKHTAGDKTYSVTKSFDVKEYVLPTFEANITGVVENNTFHGRACAIYTFNENVNGYAFIVDSPRDKLILEDGCTNITFTLLRGRRYDFYRSFTITVVEHGTGQSQNATWSGYVNNQGRYIGDSRTSEVSNKQKSTISLIYLSNGNPWFKPGFDKIIKYEVKAKTYPETLRMVMMISFKNSTHGMIREDRFSKLLARGIYNYVITNIPQLTTKIYISLKSELKGHTTHTQVNPIMRWTEIKDMYLSIQDRHNVHMCASYVKIDLAYNQKISTNENIRFHYQIIYQGKIFKVGTFNLDKQKINATKMIEDETMEIVLINGVSVDLGDALYSRFQLIIYYVFEDRIISDYLIVEREKCVQHKVKLTSGKRYKTGQKLKFRLSARPDSLCSLSVVDKSLNILAGQTDYAELIRKQIKENLAKLDTSGVQRVTYNTKGNTDCIAQKRIKIRLPQRGLRGSRGRPRRSMMMPRYWYGSLSYDSKSSFLKSSVRIFTDYDIISLNCSQNMMYFGRARGREGAVMMNSRVLDSMVDDSAGDIPADKPREVFPESWMFDLHLIEKERKIIAYRAPDTITTWLGSAVCINKQYGMGVNERKFEVQTYLTFFIKVTMPYSLKVGEQTDFPVSVHNYEKHCLNVHLYIKKERGLIIKRRKRVICVCPGVAKVVLFSVTAKHMGSKFILIRARSTNKTLVCKEATYKKRIRDSVKKSILVKPEGKPVTLTQSRYVCFNGSNTNSMMLKYMHKKREVSSRSTHARISVIGDIMGPTLSGLKHLLRMPYGCGEQNMLTMVPSIYVLAYLKHKRTMLDLQNTAREYINIGYGREFDYQHDDHSFSAFGNSDPSGSTWLTAFVLMSFTEAKAEINDYDDKKIAKISAWLRGIQLENGCYPRLGKVLHKEMKGGLADSDSDSKVANTVLTAYVMLSLIKSGETVQSRSVNEAKNCLEKSDITDAYTLALMAYAYNTIGDRKAYEKVIRKLKVYRVKKGELTHWRSVKKQNKMTFGHNDSRKEVPVSNKAIDIEITSYLLLSMLSSQDSMTEKIEKSLPVVKWLTSQRNDRGGFISTQDTIMALKALSEFAKLSGNNGVGISMSINDDMFNFDIKESNAMVLQRKKINKFGRKTKLVYKLTGNGCVLYQAHLEYNVKEMQDSGDDDTFTLTTDAYTTDKGAQVDICISYIGESHMSNMVMVEVEIPSGWIAIKNHPSLIRWLNDIKVNLKRVDVINDKINFYFEELTIDKICFDFELKQKSHVKMPKEASVFVYDYYNKDEYVRKGYKIDQREKVVEDIIVPRKAQLLHEQP